MTQRMFVLWFFWAGICFAQTTSPEEELARRIASLPESDREASLKMETGRSMPAVALALVAEGDKQRNKGGNKEALSLYRLAKTVAEGVTDRAIVATTMDRIGVIHFRQDDYPLALSVLGEALTLRRQLGDKGTIAESLDNIGKVYQWQGEFAKALEHYHQAMSLCEEIGERKGLARELHNIGTVHSARNEYREAEDHYRRSLLIKEELGDKEGIAITTNGLSGIANPRGDYIAALAHLQKALKLFEELGQTQRASVVRGNLSLVHMQLGNYDQALELMRESLSMAQTAGNRYIVSSELDRIGTLHFYRGDMAGALEHYHKALAESERIGAKGPIGLRLQNIAGVYDWQGNYDLALDYFERALAQRREAEDKGGVADLLNRIGRIHLKKGDLARAASHFRESLAVAEALETKESVALVLVNLGDLYLDKGDLTNANIEYEKALRLYDEMGNRRGAITALNRVSEVALRRADYSGALRRAERVIELAKQINTEVGLPVAHTVAARALRALQEPARAEQSLDRAIAVIEKFRDQAAGGERDQQTFLGELIEPYYEMVDLLVAQNRLPEALGFSERAKGRVLLDVLASGRSELRKSMSPSEMTRERQLANELTSLNAQLTRERQQEKTNEQRVNELEGRVSGARRGYEAFETQLYVAHPELRLRRGAARVVGMEQAASLLPDTGTALLEYVVMDDRSFLFVLTRSATSKQAVLQAYPLAIKRADLAQQVEKFRRAIEDRDLEFGSSAIKLFELLLGPARNELRGKNRLVVVPDDSLWGLPFQALQPARGRYLVEQAAVSYAPSFSVLFEIERQRDSRKPRRNETSNTLLAIGNPLPGEQPPTQDHFAIRGGATLPPLPEAEKEAKALSALYSKGKSRIYTGSEASEARVKAEAGNFTTLHFATHGVFNNASPMYSHIVLVGGEHEDGLLEAWEIMKLDLKADLVVLSACETGRGGVKAGEGLIGLSWALFVAGSPTTVVSQWKVASAATQRLMLEFHRQMRPVARATEVRHSTADALRNASLKMLKEPAHRHPFYWAGFILVGESR